MLESFLYKTPAVSHVHVTLLCAPCITLVCAWAFIHAQAQKARTEHQARLENSKVRTMRPACPITCSASLRYIKNARTPPMH